MSVAELMAARSQVYKELATTRLRPRDGVAEYLEWLRNRGFLTALASSSPNVMVQFSLSASNVDASLFSAIVDGDGVQRKKPAPDIFLKAAEMLRSSPNRCLVIEDAPPGIEAAHAAGMKCAAITGSLPPERLDKADFVVETFDQVRKWFMT